MRKVFFSFHYSRDISRVNVVRQSWRYRPGNETQPFVDAAELEQIKRQGEEAVKRWISRQMDGTTVTVVLIGAETSTRPWVKHEIKETYRRGNGLIGIRIHNIRNFQGYSDAFGRNPFDDLEVRNDNGTSTLLSAIYPTYDWVNGDGRANISTWIEQAAIRAGK